MVHFVTGVSVSLSEKGGQCGEAMESDAVDYEDLLEHVCGFCDKIFKKEVKLDRHIRKYHAELPLNEDEKEDNLITEVKKEDADEVKIEPLTDDDVKVRKMNKKYDNLYLFDPTTRIWICASCGATYQSDHGIRCHLNTTVCGFGEKDNYKPKVNYKSMYMKSDGQLTCCGCGIAYQSERGIYHHLKETVCGYGTKERMLHKKDWTPFYTLENSLYICVVCGASYDYIKGMHHHLKRKCGVDAKLKMFSSPKPISQKGEKRSPDKRDYKPFYRKGDDSLLTCLGCETVYHSMKGLKSHLRTTKCGFGDRFRSPPKTSYLQLYIKEGDQCICKGCGKIYNSSRGVHHHLNSTRCGFGEKEGGRPRNNYTAMYSFCDGQYECRRCAFKIGYMGGIHEHLKKCLAGFVEELDRLAELEKLELKDGIKSEFDKSLTQDDLDELNTLSGVERKVVSSIRGTEFDMDKISDATEEEFCDKLIANTEVASSNLSVNFADIDLD